MDIYKKTSLEDLLLVLRKNIIEVMKKDGLKDDLTFSQVQVLHFIGPHGKSTMKNIADYLKITPPSATEIIKEMERKGLVKRIGDKSDRRIVDIVFTPISKKLFNSICKRKKQFFKKMISKLGVVDRNNLERIIKILITE